MRLFRTLIALFFISVANLIIAQKNRPVEEASGLTVGTKAPLFEAIDQDSNLFVLEEALKKGSVVLIFYRGEWCPYCNRHLSNIQDSLQLIYDKGATVIAVSPENHEKQEKTIEKTDVKFNLLYDEGYKISDAYEVTFKPQKKLLKVYNIFLGADLKNAHSDDSERLPIPATYIINKDGVITWRQFDANYKNRSTVSEILKQL